MKVQKPNFASARHGLSDRLEYILATTLDVDRVQVTPMSSDGQTDGKK